VQARLAGEATPLGLHLLASDRQNR
jgi:hypothetical protein